MKDSDEEAPPVSRQFFGKCLVKPPGEEQPSPFPLPPPLPPPISVPSLLPDVLESPPRVVSGASSIMHDQPQGSPPAPMPSPTLSALSVPLNRGLEEPPLDFKMAVDGIILHPVVPSFVVGTPVSSRTTSSLSPLPVFDLAAEGTASPPAVLSFAVGTPMPSLAPSAPHACRPLEGTLGLDALPKPPLSSPSDRETYFMSACGTSSMILVGAVLPRALPLQGIQGPSPVVVLPDAVIELTARTELLLRYWHALMPEKTFDVLIIRVIQSGAYARIGRDGGTMTLSPPVSQVPPPRPDNLTIPTSIAVTADGMINRRVKRRRRTGSECCIIYLSVIFYLQGRPELRRCLTHGGILWRLVLHHFGSVDLPAALNGPSPGAVHWRVGDVDPRSQLFDDVLPSKIVNLLVGGATDGSSLWPPPDLFETAVNFPGVWTSPLEDWFDLRANAINAHTAAPLSRAEWKGSIPFWTDSQWTVGTNVGTEYFARDLLKQASGDVPDDWVEWVHPHRVVCICP